MNSESDTSQQSNEMPLPKKERRIQDERLCCGLACKMTRLYNLMRSDKNVTYTEQDFKACHSKFDKIVKNEEE